MQCDTYFQPFLDHLLQPATASHAPILTFLGAGNRAEANRFVVYMEGALSLSHPLKSPSSTKGAPTGGQGQTLGGLCNAYYSDRGEAEGARTQSASSFTGVDPRSGEIVIPPDAIASNTEITVPAGAVATPPPTHAQTF